MNHEVILVGAGLSVFGLAALVPLVYHPERRSGGSGVHRAGDPLPTGTTFPGGPLVIDAPPADAESGEYRYCPEEMRVRYCAVRLDGSARCWTCNSEIPA